MNLCGLVATIDNGQRNQRVVRASLGILDRDIPIAVAIKDSRIGDFVFQVFEPGRGILIAKLLIRVLCLGILIECFRVGMRR